MGRIIYAGFAANGIAGGQKMLLRHVEALCELGFQATYRLQPGRAIPDWLDHKAPVETGVPFGPEDVLVLPEDAIAAIKQFAVQDHRIVIFCQNQYNFGIAAVEALDAYPADRFPRFLAPGPTCAASIKRAYPAAEVIVVPCFADERLFRPGEPKRDAVAYAPRKRPLEARMIKSLFPRYHPRHARLPWVELAGMREAAVDALAQAADLVAAGGAPLRRYQEAAFETARRWSYPVFRDALEKAWTRLAPALRPA